MDEYKNVILNHNWHNMRWADRQSIDTVVLPNLKKKKKEILKKLSKFVVMYTIRLFLSYSFPFFRFISFTRPYVDN
jgi:hypothetical protein